MTTFLLLFLMVFTIASSLVIGIGLGYWVICGILNLFDPVRIARRANAVPELAPTATGD
jgi:hypothetical protein